MTPAGALARAQLGAILRSQPSELHPRGSTVARASGADPGMAGAARELERAAPGLTIMLQLRARLFDEAVRAACRRGIRQIIAIAGGFDDRRLQSARRRCVRVLDVDHPDVLTRKSSSAEGIERIPVEDLATEIMPALRRAVRMDGLRTLLLVQNASFWDTHGGCYALLQRLEAEAAPRSEMLFNVFDDGKSQVADATRVGVMPTAAAGVAPVSLAALLEHAQRLRLDVRAAFDSHHLQRMYVGFEDLLIREWYLWITNSRVPSRAPGGRSGLESLTARRTVRSRSACRVSCADRPELREDILIRWTPPTAGALARPITPLRAVAVHLGAIGTTTAFSLDGRRTLGEIARELATIVGRDVTAEVGRTVAALRVAGLLRETAAASPPPLERRAVHTAARVHPSGGGTVGVSALATVGIAALQGAERGSAMRLSRSLAELAENRAVRHLRASLAHVGGTRPWTLLGEGPLHVLVSARDACGLGRRILAAAGELLARIARLLAVTRELTVVVDVTPERPGMPLTCAEVAHPYTVVRIPRPNYSHEVVAHELTHVLATARSRWLSEGLAVWVQRAVAPGACFPDDVPTDPAHARDALARGVLARELQAARGLASGTAPTIMRDPRAAYRQAASFVRFFVEAFGLRRFLDFFAACAPTRSLDDLRGECRRNGCASLDDLERRWRRAELAA
jgi:O-methyltransferase involved in polyketide biosynthesis